MKTFENAPESLEFWKEIQRKYSPIDIYLCNIPAFEEAWQYFAHQDDLKKLAKDFLPENRNDRCGVGNLFLFACPSFNSEEKALIRSEFINWNIQRLSTICL